MSQKEKLETFFGKKNLKREDLELFKKWIMEKGVWDLMQEYKNKLNKEAKQCIEELQIKDCEKKKSIHALLDYNYQRKS